MVPGCRACPCCGIPLPASCQQCAWCWMWSPSKEASPPPPGLDASAQDGCQDLKDGGSGLYTEEAYLRPEEAVL
eukprot:9594590-Prorocentrum_lima.AAC.1